MSYPLDTSTPALSIDWNKCIKCYSCVRACDAQGPSCYIKPEGREIPMLNVGGNGVEIIPTGEGDAMKLSHYLSETKCMSCGQCSVACPVEAITVRQDWELVNQELEKTAESKGKRASVALIAPSARVGLAECFGLEEGTFTEQGLVALLRAAGFTHIFDVQTGADLTTAVDAEELMEACHRHTDIEDMGKQEGIPPLPVFTSCCPAWVSLCETTPEYQPYLANVSTARSCVAMAGALVRLRTLEALGSEYAPEDLHIVDIMPCSAKKLERVRKCLKCEINQCLTIVETAQLIEKRLESTGLTREDITFENGMISGKAADILCSKKGTCDLFLSDTSGGAYAFGRAGGVAETVVRYALREKELLNENGIEEETGEPLNIEWETVWESRDKLHRICECKHPKLTIGALGGTDNQDPAIIAYATGGSAIKEAMRMIIEGNERNWAIVEQMCCPGGCISGAGMQWLKTSKAPVKRRAVLEKRGGSLNAADDRAVYKAANDNPTLKRLFKSLSKEDQHKALHTCFSAADIAKENSLTEKY